jgi:hypothetical protein
MPATPGYAGRGIAEHVAAVELVDDAGKRAAQIAVILRVDEAPVV